jgi:hypothetical protein
MSIALSIPFNFVNFVNREVTTMTALQPQPILIQPNQFLLKGYDTEISYATTSFTGTPRFSFTRQGQMLNFSGEEIKVENTQLGQLVTVNLNGNQRAVGTVESVTMLIPAITVTSANKSAPLETIAVLSLRSPTVKLPGQSQDYMTLWLIGTANQVDF